MVKNRITCEQREGYEPSVTARNVSISHCPPGCGREGKSDDGERGEMKERDVTDQ